MKRAAATILAFALALPAAAQAPRGPESGPVLVMPPEGPADPARAFLAEAIAQRLPRALAALGADAITRADRLRAQAALEIAAPRVSQATAIRIAEVLGAARVVVGRHSGEGDQLTLALRLLDVRRGTLSAPFTVSGPLDRAALLVDELAWDLALAGPTRPVTTRAAFLESRRSPAPLAFRRLGEALASADGGERRRLLRQALDADPSYDEARVALGRQLVEVGEMAEAQDVLSRVAPTSPLLREARHLSTVALIGLGRFREAATVAGRLIAESPTAAALNNHAVAMLRGRGASKASDELRRAVDLAPGAPEPVANLALALLHEGDAAAAAFWARGAVAADASDLGARVVLTWALTAAGQREAADAEWRAVLEAAPSWAHLRERDLSRRFERLMLSERVIAIDAEGRSDAEMAAGLLARADKLSAQGDLDGAQRALTRAAYLDPYGPRVHHMLGRLHRKRGARPEAKNALRMSLWCREDPAVRAELASLLLEMGEVDEAHREARLVLEAEPGNALAAAVLGRKR